MAASITLACWIAFELVLRVRDLARHKGSEERDRATRVLIAITLGVTVGLAVATRSAVPALRIPSPHTAVGVIVMWCGLAIRAWAVVSLGSSFRTTVEVDPDQAVFTGGPYRWVRHPSYTGLWLISVGFGLSLGSAVSLVIAVLGPLPAILRRIHVEEAELEHVLGEPYVAYEAGTRRLIPGVW